MLALTFLAACAAAAPLSVSVDTTTVKQIERFLKTPVSGLTSGYIDEMLAVDPASLPARLRRGLEARRLELYALRRLAQNKRKGSVRIPEKDCEVPKEAVSQDAAPLRMAGFVEVREDAIDYLKANTHCTERQMMCEFSLTIATWASKGKPPSRRYFMLAGDPLMALVTEYETKGGNRDTKFFGRATYPVCSGS